jgi:hypothetical protein
VREKPWLPVYQLTNQYCPLLSSNHSFPQSTNNVAGKHWTLMIQIRKMYLFVFVLYVCIHLLINVCKSM